MGPILYSLYTADTPKLKHAAIVQYADDTTIFYSHRRKDTIVNRLEDDLHTLTEYFHRWKIKINANKIQVVYYQRTRKRNTPEQIKIMGSTIN